MTAQISERPARRATVSALAVISLRDVLLELGAASPEQLKATGLDRIDGESAADATPVEERRLSEDLLIALWGVAASCASVPDIGLRIGRRYDPATRGLLANWLFQCKTYGDALSVFETHCGLMNPSESWGSAVAGGELALTVRFAPQKAYPRAAKERSLSAFMRWTEELTGAPPRTISCEFSFDRPSYFEKYRETFGDIPFYFGAEAERIAVDAELLRRPLVNPNEYLRGVLQERAQAAFQELSGDAALLDKARRWIEASLSSGVSIDGLCRALHVSRATLYRRLKQDGSSFSELVDVARKDLAARMIRRGAPIGAVSDALGYRDQSAFHRAFRRWFGQSPGEWRAALTDW